jgi:hypothetical protein
MRCFNFQTLLLQAFSSYPNNDRRDATFLSPPNVLHEPRAKLLQSGSPDSLSYLLSTVRVYISEKEKKRI